MPIVICDHDVRDEIMEKTTYKEGCLQGANLIRNYKGPLTGKLSEDYEWTVEELKNTGYYCYL